MSAQHASGLPLRLPHPAQAKFVICDCTIENGLHYRCDRSMREDDSQLRLGHAPHVLSILSNTALGFFVRQEETNLPLVQRAFAYHFDRALARRAS